MILTETILAETKTILPTTGSTGLGNITLYNNRWYVRIYANLYVLDIDGNLLFTEGDESVGDIIAISNDRIYSNNERTYVLREYDSASSPVATTDYDPYYQYKDGISITYLNGDLDVPATLRVNNYFSVNVLQDHLSQTSSSLVGNTITEYTGVAVDGDYLYVLITPVTTLYRIYLGLDQLQFYESDGTDWIEADSFVL